MTLQDQSTPHPKHQRLLIDKTKKLFNPYDGAFLNQEPASEGSPSHNDVDDLDHGDHRSWAMVLV